MFFQLECERVSSTLEELKQPPRSSNPFRVLNHFSFDVQNVGETSKQLGDINFLGNSFFFCLLPSVEAEGQYSPATLKKALPTTRNHWCVHGDTISV